MIHSIYASVAVRTFTPAELAALLRQSRATNERLGITGMLLHTEGSFFQVLEGAEVAVDGLLTKICADSRHEQTTIIIRESIARRSFAEWTMGFQSVTAEDLAELVGSNDFFTEQSCLPRIDEGRAKRILAAFGVGRWRTALSASSSLVAA